MGGLQFRTKQEMPLPPAKETVFRTLPVLETDRLRLRQVRLEDAPDMLAYASDPLVSQYVLWQTHTRLMDSHAFLKAMCRKYLDGEVTEWGIEHRASGRLIGTCGFVEYHPEHFRAEIGYALSRKHWRQGLMSEALWAVIRYASHSLGLRKLEARTALANLPSQELLQKIGFRLEGVLSEHLYLADGPHAIQVWGLSLVH